MHATLTKFGYPQSLLFETSQWCVVLRPQQLTLGALVLIAKSEAPSFARLPSAAYGELEVVTRRIEAGLSRFRSFDRINYVMLMMVDPHVHFHVLPRYGAAQEFGGTLFRDFGWPGPPDFKQGNALTGEVTNELLGVLSSHMAEA